jgi:hypothetical protein
MDREEAIAYILGMAYVAKQSSPEFELASDDIDNEVSEALFALGVTSSEIKDAI